jgi:dihydrofolate reductase
METGANPCREAGSDLGKLGVIFSFHPMKKLILKISMSLDGFVGGPKGEMKWLFAEPSSKDSTQWTLARVWNASLHLMGRRTFHDMAAWWPTSKEVFAPPMNEIPKVVFSRRGVGRPDKRLTTVALKDARAAGRGTRGAMPSTRVRDSWLHPQVCTGNLAQEIKRLKRGTGKPLIAHGGAGFARSLIKTGLIDEYWLLVHPVALGRGLAIFNELTPPRRLQLIQSIPFKSGAVALIYRPRKSGAR